jgi:hypothetical protein
MYFTEAGFFEGLKRAVEVVARHRDYPGKDELVGGSLAEIDDLNRKGRLSDAERDQLRLILLASPGRTLRGEALPR